MRSLAQPRRQTFGPLSAIEFLASEGAPSGTSSALGNVIRGQLSPKDVVGGEDSCPRSIFSGAPTIVCLHGYGADAMNLASLAVQLDLAKPVRWLFPDAPLEVVFDPPSLRGRAWFAIDDDEMARVQTEGGTMDLSNVRPPGFDQALEVVSEFIQALGTPWSKIIIGGFSQGAMLSVASALQAPEAPLGLFILSGTLVDEESVRRLAPARAGLRFFQSHGTHDPLLSYQEAKKLNGMLNSTGLRGELLSFPGGHELAPQASKGLENYLNTALKTNARSVP